MASTDYHAGHIWVCVYLLDEFHLYIITAFFIATKQVSVLIKCKQFYNSGSILVCSDYSEKRVVPKYNIPYFVKVRR